MNEKVHRRVQSFLGFVMQCLWYLSTLKNYGGLLECKNAQHLCLLLHCLSCLKSGVTHGLVQRKAEVAKWSTGRSSL